MLTERNPANRSIRREAVAARLELKRRARSAGDFDARRYFRDAGDLGFYNVGTTTMRTLARSIHARHRADWSVDEAMAFADLLMPDRYLEVKAVGIEVVARYRRAFTPPLLQRWRRWLSKNYSANWATTDAICGLLIGPLLVQYSALAAQMPTWAGDRNMWVRRAAAVGLIPSVRVGLADDIAYDVARRLHGDEEDLIQKAVGWMLREAGKTNAKRLETYLRANGPAIPRTTVRYAIERFSPAARLALLKATKSRQLP